MFFICNNSLLFDPDAQEISLVGQPESVLSLSASAARLLQEFIRHKGRNLSREELITRVWEDFGFTPSGNNLNKTVSELRKSFQSLGESHEVIVTIHRYGFRFDADAIPVQKERAIKPKPHIQQSEKIQRYPWGKWLQVFAALLVAILGVIIIFRQQQDITIPAKLKPVGQKISKCSIWLINDHGRPTMLSKLAELLEKHNVACQREEYKIYYFSARFPLSAADEVFIGACPKNKSSLCKSIRYNSGVEK